MRRLARDAREHRARRFRSIDRSIRADGDGTAGSDPGARRHPQSLARLVKQQAVRRADGRAAPDAVARDAALARARGCAHVAGRRIDTPHAAVLRVGDVHSAVGRDRDVGRLIEARDRRRALRGAGQARRRRSQRRRSRRRKREAAVMGRSREWRRGGATSDRAVLLGLLPTEPSIWGFFRYSGAACERDIAITAKGLARGRSLSFRESGDGPRGVRARRRRRRS